MIEFIILDFLIFIFKVNKTMKEKTSTEDSGICILKYKNKGISNLIFV